MNSLINKSQKQLEVFITQEATKSKYDDFELWEVEKMDQELKSLKMEV
jgi:hypothetical protein